MTAKEAIDVLFNEWKCIDRNDGIHCDRKCETCDLVMDVGIIREAFNMAISALQEQETINRRNKSVQNVNIDDSVTRKIKALPSAQPQPQWIPVSKKLPEVGRSVLFSRRSMCTREGCLQADGQWWQYWWDEILNADQVTAWMPLPEPYRAERRTDAED